MHCVSDEGDVRRGLGVFHIEVEKGVVLKCLGVVNLVFIVLHGPSFVDLDQFSVGELCVGVSVACLAIGMGGVASR